MNSPDASTDPVDGPTAGPTDGPTGPHAETGDHGPRVGRDEIRDLARVRRSRSDRKVAGVAGGLARHLDIDPLLLRVGFVILTFFGGGGLILYGVAWLIVPEEDTEHAVVRVDDNVRTVALVVAGVIAAASILGDSLGGPGFPWPLWVIGLVLVAFFVGRDAIKPGGPTHPWLGGPPTGHAEGPGGPTAGGHPGYPGYQPGPPPAPRRPADPKRRGPLLFFFTMALAALGVGVVATLELAGWDVPASTYPATVLATCGLMLLVGAFYGRGGGLIFVGLVAAVATAVTTAAGHLDAGQITRSPDSAAELQSSYDLGAGEIMIDLTDVQDLDRLDGRDLGLELGFGRILVIVPEDGLTVEVDGRVEAGEVALFGDKSSSSDQQVYDGGDDAPVLTIDAEVFLGEVRVETEGANR